MQKMLNKYNRLPEKLLVLFFAVSLLPACADEKDGVLPAAKMEKVLLDINIAEGYSTMSADTAYPRGEKNADSLALYYKIIFDHHGITKDEFDKSMAWYKTHPDEMDTIVNRMMGAVEKWSAK